MRYGEKHSTVNDTRWDRAVFARLNHPFQTAVGDVEGVGLPVTIAK